MYNVDKSTYKGHPTIKISKVTDNGEYKVISFGLNKAKAILECIDAIRDFVDNTEKKNQAKSVVNAMSSEQVNSIIGMINSEQ
jgi:predicted transcriptional regulator